MTRYEIPSRRQERRGAASVVELVAEQVAARPHAPAVLRGERSIDYLELSRRSAALAQELRRIGVAAERAVVLLTGRSIELVVASLGVLESGGAYVPLDPSLPEERLSRMVEDLGSPVLIASPAHRDLQERLARRFGLEETLVLDAEAGPAQPAGDAAGPAARRETPDPRQLAYVIFTSGSTGRPKGVQVSHGALLNLCRWHRRAFEVGPDDRASLLAGVGFDASVWEIWPYLVTGASLRIAPDEVRSSPARLADWLRSEEITIGFVPTALTEELIRLPWPPGTRGPKYLLTGGDRLRRRPRADLPFRLVNDYGPTESTVVTTSGPVRPEGVEEGPPTIGRPIGGVSADVVGPDLRPREDGKAGELVIGGESLARGYLGRPARTAEVFVPSPFGRTAGARLYRTGDLCRRRPDGEIEFLGRIDDQVKVRGHRIELGEIESALSRHPRIRQAVVVAQEGPGGTRLVGYLVASGDGPELSPESVRAYLAQSLPASMIPGLFVRIETLPLTPNGKIDRAALPAPPSPSDLGEASTPTERYLVDLWRDLFGHDAVGAESDFFELGGHSLIVAQLCSRVREHLGVELDPRAVFDEPTVARLAEHLDGAERATHVPPVRRADRDRDLRLSFAQERVWFLQELVPGTIAYNSQLTLRLRGPLDVERLDRAFEEIVRRHEILRTVFVTGPSGHPVQRIEPPFEIRLPVTDLRDMAPELREAHLEALIAEELRRPFDLGRLPLVRWSIYRLGEEEHVLLQVEHHFLHDGWAVSVLLGELQEIYTALREGRPHRLPEPRIQYVDFALWQRDWLRGEALDRLLSYWRRRLEDAPPVLELPTDRPRPERTSFQGDALELSVPQRLYASLRETGHRHGWTLFVTMLAAMYALLERMTGRSDLVLGSGMANRRMHELEGMIGMVVNTVVLRTDLSGDPTVRQLWTRVRETALEAHVHQDLPFDKLVEELRPDRGAGRNPLVQMLFSFHDAPVPDLRFADLESEIRYRNNGTAKTDLNVIGIPRAEQRRGRADATEHGMRFLWEYDTELFDRTTIRRTWHHYLQLLGAMVAEPDRRLRDLPLLSPAERAQVSTEWSDTAADFPRDATIDRLVADQARLRGDAVAVVCGEGALSYAELDRRAGRLARRLRRRGVSLETPVALQADRSIETVVALLAILRAGGAYVPLDLASPPARLRQILDEVAPPVIFVRRDLEDRLPAHEAEPIVLEPGAGSEEREGAAALPRFEDGSADALAYVMYTSGSTGRPKGVAISQRNVLRLVRGSRDLDLGPDRVFLQFAPLSFDASTLEIWGPLVNGGRLELFPPIPPSLDDLVREVETKRIDTLWLTAGLFHQLSTDHLDRMTSVRQLLAGGDVLLPEAVRRVIETRPEIMMINGYGPTEGTTFTACHRMRATDGVASPVPIGRPIANTTVSLLDRLLRPVVAGVAGELLAGGEGVGRGYYDQPRRTAEAFVPHPRPSVPGERLYRTGDLARWLPDGRIEFLGRRDSQIKVRGFRIEPGEIETALRLHPGVRDATVVAPRDRFGDRRLVAYWVPAAGVEPTPDALRGHLESRLPDYLVPSALVRLDAIPLTPNGKVDRAALPEPDGRSSAAPVYRPPETETARLLAAIWAEHLEAERIGLDDRFFDLGGHSLLAIRILARIREELGIELSLSDFLDAGSVGRLEETVEWLQIQAAGDELLGEILDEV